MVLDDMFHVLISKDCHNKSPRIGWLQITEMCSFIALETRSLEFDCQQGHAVPEPPKQESSPAFGKSLWWFLTSSVWLTCGLLYFCLWSYSSLTVFFISVPRITPPYKEMVSQWLGAHHNLPRLHFYLLAFMKTLFLNEDTFIATMVRVYTTPGGSEFNPFRLVCLILCLHAAFISRTSSWIQQMWRPGEGGRTEKRILKSLFIWSQLLDTLCHVRRLYHLVPDSSKLDPIALWTKDWR